ncbi:MAG: hypothetical protein AB8B53_06145 [Flavobacteriales bacterium]
MDKHRLAIRKSGENLLLNFIQSLLALTVFLTIFVGFYQLAINLYKLFTAKRRFIRLLLIVYWILLVLLAVLWSYRDMFLGDLIVGFEFIIVGVVLSFYSCFIRWVEYRMTKLEHQSKVTPYTFKEQAHNDSIDNRQIFYAHIMVVILGMTVYLSVATFIYLLIMDVLLYRKTKNIATRSRLLLLAFCAAVFSLISFYLSTLSLNGRDISIAMAIFITLLGIYSTWIRFREYRHSKNRFNSLF